MDNFRALTMACAQAVCTSVSTANDQYPFARRKDLRRRIDSVTLVAMVLLGQKLHRIMDAFKFASRNLQIARLLGSAGNGQGWSTRWKMAGLGLRRPRAAETTMGSK